MAQEKSHLRETIPPPTWTINTVLKQPVAKQSVQC